MNNTTFPMPSIQLDTSQTRRSSVACLLLSLALFSVAASAEIRRNPNGVNVNSQGATTVFITFGGLQEQVPVEATWCGELIPATPDIGFRCDPSTLFGRLPIRFDQSRLDGSVFTDIMSIPPSVARRAYQAAEKGATSSFFYVRRFSSTVGGPDEFVFVTCRLAGGGARVPLALTDVKTRFDEDRAVFAVPAGGRVPAFRSHIAYNGTGRLRGRWEVVLPGDEQPTSTDLLTAATLPQEERGLQRRYTVLSRFDVFLPPTGRIVLPGPTRATLPTEVDGVYQILLRIEASDDKEGDSSLAAVGAGTGVLHNGAVAGFPMPILRYTVGSSYANRGQSQLALLSPASGARLKGNSLEFRWQQDARTAIYKLEVRGAGGEILIEALLQQGIGTYRPPSWLRTRASGASLTWRVTAIDDEGEELVATEWRELEIP